MLRLLEPLVDVVLTSLILNEPVNQETHPVKRVIHRQERHVVEKFVDHVVTAHLNGHLQCTLLFICVKHLSLISDDLTHGTLHRPRFVVLLSEH